MGTNIDLAPVLLGGGVSMFNYLGMGPIGSAVLMAPHAIATAVVEFFPANEIVS